MAQGGGAPCRALGSRNKSRLLLYNDFKYMYLTNKKRGGTVYWRCHREECRVTLSTYGYQEDADNPPVRIKVEPARAHDHTEDTTLINKDKFKTDALRFVGEDSGRQVGAAYQATLKNIQQGGGDLSSVPDFRSVRRTLY